MLSALFSEVLVPPDVAEELRHPKPNVVVVEPTSVRGMRVTEAPNEERVRRLLPDLHPGEAQAIALALELRIKTILIDERDAYGVAVAHGLEPIGVLGVLVRAKAAGLVGTLRPLLGRLRSELNFYMTDRLESEVLRRAGE